MMGLWLQSLSPCWSPTRSTERAGSATVRRPDATQAGRGVSVPGPLPEFRDPPVGEVALAAYFDPLEDFQPIHLGALRAKWRDRYPGFEQHPEAPPVATGEAPLLAVRFSLQLLDRPQLGRA